MNKPRTPLKLVDVTPKIPEIGTVTVNVDHIIAMSARGTNQYKVIFENTIWELTPDDFENLRNAWRIHKEMYTYVKEF